MVFRRRNNLLSFFNTSYIVHGLPCPYLPIFSFLWIQHYRIWLSASGSQSYTFCFVFFLSFFLHLIQLENSLPQTHPLTYSFLSQSRTFSGFPCLPVMPLAFLGIISSLLFFSLPPIPSKLLKSTLNSCPESPNYSISFVFPVMSPLSAFSSPWTKSPHWIDCWSQTLKSSIRLSPLN